MKGSVANKFRSIYRIKTTRAEWWDYCKHGSYFVTINTKDHQHYFGEISGNNIELSECGVILENICKLLPAQFPNAYFEELIIMPNHFHAIIVIKNSPTNYIEETAHGGFSKRLNPMINESLGTIIRWLKGRTTYEIHKSNASFAWHTRYYEHIIRDNLAYQNIQDYINNNIEKWLQTHLTKS